LPIPAQLNAGIRFLDLRLHADPDKVQLAHRFDTSYDLPTVLSAVNAFLRANPTEFVVLYIRPDWDHRLAAESPEVPCERRRRVQEIIADSGLDLARIDSSCFSKTIVREVAGKAILLIPNDGSVLSCRKEEHPPFLDARWFYKVSDIWRCGSVAEAKTTLDRYLGCMHTDYDGFQAIAIDVTVIPFTPGMTSPGLNSWFLEKLDTDPAWIARRNAGPLGVVLIDFADEVTVGRLLRPALEKVGVEWRSGSGAALSAVRSRMCFGSL
jgi:hypothetical protein